MTLFVLILAVLPLTLLAGPISYNEQDAIKALADDPAQWIQMKFSIQNDWPVEVRPSYIHYRGETEVEGAGDFEWLLPGNRSSAEPFWVSTRRRDWDKWEIGMKFRDPDWGFSTMKFDLAPEVDDIERGLVFDLRGESVVGRLKSQSLVVDALQRFENLPKEAVGINEFFFLSLQNDFDTKVGVDVELMTRSDTWWQDQSFIEDAGASSDVSVPFFFERNSTKQYVELFNFKVSRKGRRPLVAKQRRCEIGDDDRGKNLRLTIDSSGWIISALQDGRTCGSKWDVPALDVSDDDGGVVTLSAKRLWVQSSKKPRCTLFGWLALYTTTRI